MGGMSMPQSHFFFWRVVVLFVLLLPAAADAVLVSHHGNMVESQGTVRDCLSCHDGAISGKIAICTTDCATNASHSVLKSYPPAGRRARDFRPLGDVRQMKIKIVGGMVTCISCHNLSNQEKYHLVMDNKNNQLCLGCHLK
jgi:predicted CXXCH cytochrome family protein